MINHPNRSRVARNVVQAVPVYDYDRDYKTFRLGVQVAFDEGKGPLFQTDAVGLYRAYLDALPSDRQAHSCTACRRFIEHFGGLVRVADDGSTTPAMWRLEPTTEFYAQAAQALHAKVRRARIERPFLTNHAVLGLPKTGEWEHFAIHNAPVFHHALRTPGQAAAAKVEDFRTVSSALADFTVPTLDEALRLLEAGHLNRAERFVAPVKWLRMLHDRPKGRAGENLLWREIATAPDEYCHPRAAVTGSLLEDIAKHAATGMTFRDIKARFDAKVAPLVYQRPQAAPSAGTIAVAEAIFEKMGLVPALDRRFARLDDCLTIWQPVRKAPQEADGVFGHLTPKGASAASSLAVPDLTMTWAKFLATVLPNAQEMQMLVPSYGNFTALLTAANQEAPPILKWDRQERRNPVSWYVYNGGSPAGQWRLITGWAKVTAVVPSPATWGDDPKAYLGEGFVLTLDGAVDMRTSFGNALFPETMRGELHAIRSVIEAYSRTAQISGREEASACGYMVTKGQIGIMLRVVAGGKSQGYKIDRWD